MAHLTTLGLFPRGITISHNQELHGNLDHIASLEAAGDRQGQEKEARGAHRTDPNLSSVREGVCLGDLETGDVSNVTVALK